MRRRAEKFTASEIWADIDAQQQAQACPASEGWRTLRELERAWGCCYSTAVRRAEEMLTLGVMESAVRTTGQHPCKVYRPVKKAGRKG